MPIVWIIPIGVLLCLILSVIIHKILLLGWIINIKPQKFSGENTIADGAANEAMIEGDGKSQ